MTSPIPAAEIPQLTMPIIEGFVTAVGPGLTILMVTTILSSMLVPLLVAVFAFSTSKSRRHPLFMFIVFDILLGIGLGIWYAVIEVRICGRS